MQRLRSRIQTKSEPFIQAWNPNGNKQKWKNMRITSSTRARKTKTKSREHESFNKKKKKKTPQKTVQGAGLEGHPLVAWLEAGVERGDGTREPHFRLQKRERWEQRLEAPHPLNVNAKEVAASELKWWEAESPWAPEPSPARQMPDQVKWPRSLAADSDSTWSTWSWLEEQCGVGLLQWREGSWLAWS